jgi:hypothetical protein
LSGFLRGHLVDATALERRVGSVLEQGHAVERRPLDLERSRQPVEAGHQPGRRDQGHGQQHEHRTLADLQMRPQHAQHGDGRNGQASPAKNGEHQERPGQRLALVGRTQ